MRHSSSIACLVLLSSLVRAQSTPVAEVPPDTAPLDEVVVTGEYPGPGLWKVMRAEDPGHVLWIAADPPPLPVRMKWKSKDFEAVALASQEILVDSAVRIDSDEKIGFFRGLTLLPSLLKARRNPDDAELESLLPPDLYARWLKQKKLYLSHESGVEKWRPLFAADKLRKAAFEGLRLREGGAVMEVIGKLARDQKIQLNTPMLRFTFKSSEVRDKIKEFSRESLADVECFGLTLDLTEALADTETQNARARAWARGDEQALERLPALPSPYLSCAMAVMGSQVAREILPADIREQLYGLWLDTAARSLAANPSTFAIVPFAKLTSADGYLARLRAKGFIAEEP